MSYTPIGWQTGDTIIAEKLNKMDPGWGVSSTQFFSETVTTTDTGQGFAAGNLTYVFQSDPPETAVITFDGTDYTCNWNGFGYGEIGESGPDFTTYPFYLMIQSGEMGRTIIYTSTASGHTVALSANEIEISDAFNSAVQKCVGLMPMLCIDGTTTYGEMIEASSKGRILYFKPYGSEGTETCFITVFDSISVGYIQAISNVSATFDNNGIFTVNNTN